MWWSARYAGGSLDRFGAPCAGSSPKEPHARLVTGLAVHDATAGFKCFRREALQRIGLAEVRSQGYNFQIEGPCAASRRAAGGEYPIHFRERDAGPPR